ncbi:MAG: amidohydrolase family protein [Chloroflexi bacterium]|nr:amidohydrolase family protein [Chloroflexota bacterium]
MEPDQPAAQAIAIKEERILAVGSEADILAYGGPATQVIDLQGRTIMPGFIDAHSHLFNDAGSAGMDIDQAQQQALEYGITTFADMFVTPEFLDEMQAYQQAGKLRLRTSLYLIYTDPCGVIQGDWYKEHPPTREPGEMLRIGGVKIFADGGVCGKAALSTGYPGGGNGDLWFTQDELNQVVADIQNAGYQVAIHAQGDLAIEQAQNAIEFALGGEPNTSRHRIEHNPFARPDLLGRYSEIGIVPIAWGEYPTCAEVNDSYYSSYFGAEPMPWLENWRAFLDANPDLPVAWHSDFPYADLNPFLHLYSYVTRQEIDEDGSICTPPDWLAAHRITVDEALPMMTINAAYALFRDEEAGSLKAGKFADLILVSDDPTAIDPNDIINLQVWMTMVGGRVEFCSDEHASLCPGTDAATETGSTSPTGINASASLPSDPPENAFDGDVDTVWNSGDDAPQWIAIDLGAPTTVTGIRLTVAQYPNGYTVHRVLGKGTEGDYQLLYEFAGETQDGDVLVYTPPEPWRDIRFVKIETTESPSWAAWKEIVIETP